MLRQRPGRVVSGCTVQRNRRTAEPQTERMTLRAEMESGRQVREPQTVQHGFTLWWLGEDHRADYETGCSAEARMWGDLHAMLELRVPHDTIQGVGDMEAGM